jgi:hypothetical protein
VNLHRVVRWCLGASLALAGAAWWMQGALPPPERLQAGLDAEPVQTRVTRPPIEARVDGVDYRIQPRYAYDMSALVVSLHHSDSFWDYAHKAWGDHVNLMDLCVVWGGTARSGAYRAISFSNTQWECHWQTGSREAWAAVNEDEIANNHMVTDDPAIARALREVHVGDQIRVRGYLVDYTVLRDGRPAGTRVSSDTRKDRGNGACEVLYVESIERLDSPGRRWRLLLKAALAAFALAAVAWLCLPVRALD